MSSFQIQQTPSQPQPQQQQQPPIFYPNTVVTRPPPSSPSSSSSSHSNGSFGTVFIVLAAIVVISAISCLLGRLCTRKSHRNQQKPPRHKSARQDHSNALRHKEWEPRESDLEFGLEKMRIPTSVKQQGVVNGNPEARVENGGKPGTSSDVEFGFEKRLASGEPGGGGGGGGGSGLEFGSERRFPSGKSTGMNGESNLPGFKFPLRGKFANFRPDA